MKVQVCLMLGRFALKHKLTEVLRGSLSHCLLTKSIVRPSTAPGNLHLVKRAGFFRHIRLGTEMPFTFHAEFDETKIDFRMLRNSRENERISFSRLLASWRAPAGFALPSPLASTARAWRACGGRVLFRHLLERAALGGELFFVGVGHVRGDVGAVGVARVGGVVPHALGHWRPLVGEGAALATQMLDALLFLQVSAVRAGATLSSMSMMVMTLCSGSSSR